VDASGVMPSGEKFSGVVELRQLLVQRKEECLRHLTSKALVYTFGRSLQDGDGCTVQRLVDTLEKDNNRARTLIREIALTTTPTRKLQRLLGEK